MRKHWANAWRGISRALGADHHAGAAPKRPETQREVVVGLCFIAVHALSLLLRCARPANLFFLPTATAA